jgi:hypothetical protein
LRNPEKANILRRFVMFFLLGAMVGIGLIFLSVTAFSIGRPDKIITIKPDGSEEIKYIKKPETPGKRAVKIAAGIIIAIAAIIAIVTAISVITYKPAGDPNADPKTGEPGTYSLPLLRN